MENSRSWKPKTKEDMLLHAYWKKIGGIIYTEVPIGGPGGRGKWPIRCTQRRLDGVRIVTRKKEIRKYVKPDDDFIKLIVNFPVEIIEIKKTLNRPAIGQIIAGNDMFAREYKVAPKKQIILCSVGDSALEWVCAKRKISIEKVNY
jgi:hypothetical protein